jgi:hypothetical protein
MEDRFVAALLSASISKDTKNITTPVITPDGSHE